MSEPQVLRRLSAAKVGRITSQVESDQSTVMLVGHHDGQMPGPLSDQTIVIATMNTPRAAAALRRCWCG